MSQFLEFTESSASQWKEKIIADLKGKDFSSIISKTMEGIDIMPFYTSEDQRNLQGLHGSNPWKIHQDFYGESAQESNTLVLEALMAGVSSIGVRLTDSGEDVSALLDKVILDIIDIHVSADDPERSYVAMKERFEDAGKDVNQWSGSIAHDPLGDLIKNGEWTASEDTDLQAAWDLARKTEAHQALSTITVRGEDFMNAGADHLQDLVYTLLKANEYLEQGKKHGLNAAQLSKKMRFSSALDTDFFMSCSKIRALRLLWANLLQAHSAALTDAHILAKNSLWEMAPIDHHSNLLRLSTVATSAAVGSANAMSLSPFDGVCSSFSMRMSRNIQHLLKHESHVDKVINPLEGAYLFDAMTHELATKAWSEFKRLSSRGGYLELVKNGEIQSSIKQRASEKLEAINSGEKTWLGVNLYRPTEASEFKPYVLAEKQGKICRALCTTKKAAS